LLNAGDFEVSATAEYGPATSYGVHARGGYYDITTVTNNGDITASASTGDGVGWAWGIRCRGRTKAEMGNAGEAKGEAEGGPGHITRGGDGPAELIVGAFGGEPTQRAAGLVQFVLVLDDGLLLHRVVLGAQDLVLVLIHVAAGGGEALNPGRPGTNPIGSALPGPPVL